jgi:hypothetical protein
MIKITIKNTLKIDELFQKIAMGKNKGIDFNAKSIVGAKFLNWILYGSPTESTTPPIKDSYLRGSGSVHVGTEEIKGVDSDNYDTRYRDCSVNENFNIISIIFNA